LFYVAGYYRTDLIYGYKTHKSEGRQIKITCQVFLLKKEEKLMGMTDEEFREEYKPLHVPAHYDPADTLQNKMIFALAEIGEGTAEEVIAELERREPGIPGEQNRAFVQATLGSLFEHGHLTGSEKQGVVHYNLSKITHANDGATDPDLLTPGLD
jgi:hypothetical protein